MRERVPLSVLAEAHTHNVLHRLPTKTSPQRRTVSLTLDKQRRAITLARRSERRKRPRVTRVFCY